MEDVLTYALTYAAAGWYVFPVRGKLPALDLAPHWSHNSTTDPQQIVAWYAGSSGLGIGLDLEKSHKAVIDGDHLEHLHFSEQLRGWPFRGNRARRSWLYNENGHPIPQSRHPWGEVKAAGGYVVLPPSPHDSGVTYEWLDGMEGEQPPTIPEAIEKLIAPRSDPGTGSTWNGAPPTDTQTQAATSKLAHQAHRVAGAAAGARNQTLNEAALIVGHYAPHYLAEKTITETLIWAAEQCGLIRDDGEKQCAATIRSGLKAGMAQPQQLDDTDTETDTQRDNRRGYINWPHLWATQTEDREHLVPGLWTVGAGACIYSPAGAGKSLLGLEWALLLSLGQPIHNQPTQPRTILYLDLENDETLLRERIDALGHYGHDLTQLHYSLLGDWQPLDTKQGGSELVAEATRLNADAVIIDTTSRIIIGEENSADTFLNLYRHTMRPLKALGIAALRLDHAGKDPTKGERGSSAKRSDVDIVYRLTQTAPDIITLKREKNRLHLPGPDITRLRRTEDPLRHTPLDRDAARERRISELIATMAGLGIPPGASRREIRQKFIDHNIPRGIQDVFAEAVRKYSQK